MNLINEDFSSSLDLKSNEEVQSVRSKENFPINLDDVQQKLGFYTTRYVEAQNEEAAEYAVMEILRGDPKLAKGVLNDKSDPPMMYAEEVEEIDSFEGLPLPVSGFSFYPDEKEA